MKIRTQLAGVGILALAGALAAAPAHASTETDGADTAASDEESEEATSVGPQSATPASGFAGFNEFTVDFSADTNLDQYRVRFDEDNYVGNINDPDSDLIVRDDVGVDFGDPDNIAPYAVHLFQQRNSDGAVFFNCSGSVINPRTILFAAHCVNDSEGPIATTSSETYGLAEAGAETTILVATGQSSADRIFTYIGTGAGYADGGVASSTDVIIHPTANPDNVGLGFPWADIALIALDAPILDVPSLPILLTPLTELTHVVQVGYGTNGTGLTGGTNPGSSFLRRIGENMLGLLGSTGDYIDGVFPAFAPSTEVLGFESQVYYWTDFDNPDRTPEQQAGCEFTGTNISCGSLDDVLAIDYFDGDALPLESGTAPGDSGSPLVADELADFPLAIGVLSGGFDFFGLGSAYSDVSFYNPLFPFFEFITENTPYKYVSANEGDGNWSDPTHWTQDLDPGFFIQDANGNVVNGIPEGNEPGIFAGGPKLGSVLGEDISGNSTAITPGFEDIDVSLPESSALLGPGSTGFVPQNTDGTIGTAFANPAQYFEVHLNRAGTTTVDIDVEIDKLVIDNVDAGVFVGEERTFTSIQGIEQFAGLMEVDGLVTTPLYTLASGEVSGDGGTFDVNALINVAGLLSAGGDGAFGTLTIDGDYVQTSGAGMLSEFSVGRRGAIEQDFYTVTGAAVLDGTLLVATGDRRPKFGTEYVALSAGSVDGNFQNVELFTNSATLIADTRVEGGDVIVEIKSRSIEGLVGRNNNKLKSLGAALDDLRASSFDQFADLFAIIDGSSFANFGATLSALTPTSAFSQTFTANSFSHRFTGQLAQRTLALRGGSRAAGGFTAAGNASYAIAGEAPAEVGKLGVFGSASGVFVNGGQQQSVQGNGTAGFGAFGINGVSSGEVGANAFEQAALVQAGEITVGADMRVSDGFSFGVAVSNIRNSQQSFAGFQGQEDSSQAVAIYASYEDGGMFADGYAGTAEQRFGVDRQSQGDFRAAFETAVGQSSGSQVFGGVRMGYAFDLSNSVEVGPVVSMDYLRNNIGGYDEVGASAFGLSVADRTFTSVGAKVGAMASVDIKTGETSAIKAFGSVAYARELADTEDVVTAHFFGAADTPFTIANALDPQWVSVNAGAEMAVGQNMSASISVTSDMGRGLLSNDQAQVGLNWRF